jgi:hypothetical protein
VLPPPATSLRDAIVVTTPCVIANPGPADWHAYLDRTLPKIALEPKLAYERLMKRGLDERFWFEYVFEAYASHSAEAVFLRGLPDIPESRPHSRVNEDRDALDLGG